MQSFTDKMYNRRQFAPPASDFITAQGLTADTAQVLAVPQDAAFVVFSAAVDFYVRFGADDDVVAAVPAGSITDGSASEFNPEAREIPPGITHFSLIATGAGVVTMAWYGA